MKLNRELLRATLGGGTRQSIEGTASWLLPVCVPQNIALWEPLLIAIHRRRVSGRNHVQLRPWTLNIGHSARSL